MSEGFILGLLAETPLHPGAGQSAGVVDLPVAREGATDLPQIPETGLKGALKQWARTVYDEQGEDFRRLFGSTEAEGNEGGAGELLISTGRLLFLPVRRLDAAYAWVTSPYLLERLGRDAKRTRVGLTPPALKPAQSDEVLWTEAEEKTVFLEEYVFAAKSMGVNQRAELKATIGRLVEQPVADRVLGQAAVMQDGEFAWFAKNALPVDARNSLNEAKMSQNLWYEETLPPDTLLYAVILPRTGGKEALGRFEAFKNALRKAEYVQAGGNETVGHGWLRVSIVEG